MEDRAGFEADRPPCTNPRPVPNRGDRASKFSKVELIKVEPAIQLWVGRKQNLKTTIKNEAVDVVGTNSATDVIGSLNHLNANSGSDQGTSTRQSGKTCSHDYDIFVHPVEVTDYELPTR